MDIRPSLDYPILRRPQVSMGVGFQAATLIWAAGAMGALTINWPLNIIPLVMSGGIHAIATWFFSLDHKIFEIYSHYGSTPNTFRAGLPTHGESFKSRPEGYGKLVSK
jgi:type IV secretory pathway VirB3-like protein